MTDKDKIQLFENQPIRSAWNSEEEEWYFSVVDVVRILTDQPTQRGASNYWKVLKSRLKEEGAQLVTKCNQLKLISSDGKRYKTDVATTEQLLRIIYANAVFDTREIPNKQGLSAVLLRRRPSFYARF